jgi:ADP-ribose pyrophosphatase YjhB (NUDIX family)
MENIKRYGGIIVKHKNEVLMCKRNAEGSLPGVWSIPAGKMNEDENPTAGAKREFHEETNIKVKDKIQLCGFINRTTRDGKRVKGLMYVYLWEVDKKVKPDLENAIDGDEHTECGYFGLDNLPPHDEDDKLMKLIKNILTKS